MSEPVNTEEIRGRREAFESLTPRDWCPEGDECLERTGPEGCGCRGERVSKEFWDHIEDDEMALLDEVTRLTAERDAALAAQDCCLRPGSECDLARTVREGLGNCGAEVTRLRAVVEAVREALLSQRDRFSAMAHEDGASEQWTEMCHSFVGIFNNLVLGLDNRLGISFGDAALAESPGPTEEEE